MTASQLAMHCNAQECEAQGFHETAAMIREDLRKDILRESGVVPKEDRTSPDAAWVAAAKPTSVRGKVTQ